MTLWFLLSRLESGGLEKVQITIAKSLRPYFNSIQIVAGKIYPYYANKIPREIGTKEIAKQSPFLFPFGLLKALYTNKPNYIITASGDVTCILLILKILFFKNIKIIATHHLSLLAPIERANQLKRIKLLLIIRIMRTLYPYLDHIVAVSHGVADDISNTLHIPRSKIAVIYNPVINDEFKSQMNMPFEPPWDPNEHREFIIFVGRLSPEKRLDLLFAAYENLLKEKNITLLVAGDGPLLDWCKKTIEEKQWKTQCYLIGFTENILPLIKNASLLVLPSNYEGLPTVLIEALGCGTQIVSTNCPSGPAEILSDGRYGQLIPMGDAEKLASAIKNSLNKTVFISSEQLQEQARNFSNETAIPQYLNLLNIAKK